MEGILSSADPARRILILTTNAGSNVRGMPLCDELAAQFAAEGHHVDILALDWSAPTPAAIRRYRPLPDVEVLLVPPVDWRLPAPLATIARWTLSSVRAAVAGRSLLAQEYDLVFALSPAAAMALPIVRATRRPATSYCYITDFFPFHQAELGLFPGGVSARGAAKLETALLRRFDVIGCMSDRGVAYLREHYALRATQRAEVLPLWSAAIAPVSDGRAVLRARYGLPIDLCLSVFGGQLAPGRGLDDIIDAAERLPTDCAIVVIGDGPLRQKIKQAEGELGGRLLLLPPIPRRDYLALLAACDIGLVATVADVSVPTFPSKTIDYLKTGLPVVASVERTTDFGDYVAKSGIGLAVEAGSGDRLAGAIASLASNPAMRATMARAALIEGQQRFSVAAATQRLLSHLPRPDAGAL